MVDHTYGAGATRLIGTMPGTGYATHRDAGTRAWFAEALQWAGVVIDPVLGDDRLFARLHIGAEADFLWILNHERQRIETTVHFGAHTIGEGARPIWGNEEDSQRVDDLTAQFGVGARAGLVVRLPH